jgi:FkbM family methyltransferase
MVKYELPPEKSMRDQSVIGIVLRCALPHPGQNAVRLQNAKRTIVLKTAARWVRSHLSLMAHERMGALLPAWPVVLRRLKRQGFEPRTVFDIGVADGTPDLYAAFPEAQYYLIDPTMESLPHMQRIARRLDAKVMNFALGEKEAELVIGVRPDDIAGSTFFEEIGPIEGVKHYPVKMRRFDQVVNGFARPALCKIDVQGSELDVLRGIGERIHDIDVIIIESSVIATIKDGPEIADIVLYLKEKGFALHDMLGSTRRPLDNALAQLDLMFVQEDSAFRADKRWSA